MNTEPELELEIFRAGDYGAKGDWPEAALDQIAHDYNAELHEAPVTLDNAQTGPALGWVAAVKRCGDRLFARLRGLNRTLVDLLRQGAFKKRSVELYSKIPETGRPYLKAVSFLGAAAPAVKGLRDPIFGEETESIRFLAELGDYVPFDFREEPPTEEPGMSHEKEDQKENDNEQETAKNNLRSCAERFAEIESRLRESGRWHPDWESRGIREFFAALAALDEIEISPEQSVAPADWFGEFLTALPAHVPMGEAAAVRRFAESLPHGGKVNAASVELHRRAEEFRRARPGMSYAEALVECGRGREV
ncbi:hypothetical protein HY256_11950 [Candidatus Sumerlaeota bacterium]|nr:hypothetical protein [Candidatus Sumerlaeota bacterium]